MVEFSSYFSLLFYKKPAIVVLHSRKDHTEEKRPKGTIHHYKVNDIFTPRHFPQAFSISKISGFITMKSFHSIIPSSELDKSCVFQLKSKGFCLVV